MSTTFTPPRPDQWEGPATGFTPPPVSAWEGPAPVGAHTFTAGGFAKDLWEAVGGKTLLDIMGGASRDPERARIATETARRLVEGIAREPQRIWNELSRSGQGMVNLNPTEAVGGLAFSAPMFGAQGREAKEAFDQGDNQKGLAITTAMLAPFVAKPGLRVAQTTARVAGAGARAAAPDLAMGTAKVGAGYAMERMLPGAGYLKYAVELPTAYSGAKQIGRGLKKGFAASRAELNARATAAAEVLAKQTEAAAQEALMRGRTPLGMMPEPPAAPMPPVAPPTPPPFIPPGPGPWRMPPVTNEPPIPSVPRFDVSGTAAEAAHLTPEARAAYDYYGIEYPPPDEAAARPTPPPEPASSPPATHMRPAAQEAAQRMRQEMGLQPGQFETPALAEAPEATGAQIDRAARAARQVGFNPADFSKVQTPQLQELAKSAGYDGPLGDFAQSVRKRMELIETETAKAAKYQVALDRLTPAERAVTRAEKGPTSRFSEAPAVETAKADLSAHKLFQPGDVISVRDLETGGWREGTFEGVLPNGNYRLRNVKSQEWKDVLPSYEVDPRKQTIEIQSVVERKPPGETTAPTTAEQANVELGKSLSVEMPAEKPPALTASQKRVAGMAAILAEGEIPVEQLRGGLKTDVRARLFLESESQRLGYGKIAAGELDRIIAEIERLRSEAPNRKAK